MKVFRYLAVSLDSILAHRMRAGLTMLGIIIGIAAVLITVGIGSGAAASITERIESSGTNLLTVNSGASRGSSDGSTLTMGDAALLADRSQFPDIAAVAPQFSSNATLTYGSTDGSYTVVGVTADYATVTNKDVESGLFLSEGNVTDNASVIVLGATVAADLFGGDDPIGQNVRVGDNLFQVVGVLAESGGSGFGSSDTQAYVPIGVAQGRLFNAARNQGSYVVSSLSVQVADAERIDAVELQIERLLRLRHRLGAADENDFTIFNQADSAGSGRRCGGHPHCAPGQYRRRQPVGGRHRHHEHHARLGDRAHQRDRPAPGLGRPRRRHFAPVLGRGVCALCAGRPGGDRVELWRGAGHCQSPFHAAHHRHRALVSNAGPGGEYGQRFHLRPLSGHASHAAGSRSRRCGMSK